VRDFFEGVGRIVCFVLVVGAVVWVRSELKPKPYTPPVMPPVTFNTPMPPPALEPGGPTWSQNGYNMYRERENLDRTQQALDEYERKYGNGLTPPATEPGK
jgi:hypothetical protein